MNLSKQRGLFPTKPAALEFVLFGELLRYFGEKSGFGHADGIGILGPGAGKSKWLRQWGRVESRCGKISTGDTDHFEELARVIMTERGLGETTLSVEQNVRA